MIVYRIESKDQLGPYQHDILGPLLRERHNDVWSYNCRWPAGYYDMKEFKDDYYFGFATLEDCCKWFNNDWEVLSRENFICSVYDAGCHVLKSKSNKQIMFDLKTLVLITQYNITKDGINKTI